MTSKRALYESIMGKIQPVIKQALQEAAQKEKEPELPFSDADMASREFKAAKYLFDDLKAHEKDVKLAIDLMRIISPDGKERYRWVSYKKIIPYLKKLDKLTDEQLKAI